MHDFRTDNIAELGRISAINHIVVPGASDRRTLNLRRNGTRSDDSALSSENKAQREMKISATKRQRMLDYCSSGDARWSPALSISAPIFFETLGAWPVVCCCTGAPVASGATVLVSGRVAAGDR